LLEKNENIRDSISSYNTIKSFYVHLGKLKKSYDYLDKINNLMIDKYGKISTIRNTITHEDELYIYKHLNMMDSVKTYLDFFAENTVPPYNNMVPYAKCLYYLYRENYDMLAATIDDAEAGYAEF
jgi:hypothetical protein